MDGSNEAAVPSGQAQQTETLAPDTDLTRPDSEHFNKQASDSARLQPLSDHIFHFLSNASNEALVAVFAGLAVATFIILGRLGLLLIGFVAGIVLHSSWEGTNSDSPDNGSDIRKCRRKELGVEVANRLLEWQLRRSAKEGAEDDTTGPRAAEEQSAVDLNYSKFPPATAAALRSLTDAIIDNYVNHWYAPILPSEPTFPLSCRRTLTGFIVSVSSHLSRKRPADTFLQFLTNSSSMVIVFLNELSTALQTTASSLGTPEGAIRKYLEDFPESSLANVLAVKQQRKKLNMVADDLLSNFLDSKTYECQPVRTFLREILSGVVLESTIKSCSRPEFINSWIIHLLQEGEPEIMNAIDAGVEGARKDQNKGSRSASVSESIVPHRSSENSDSQFPPEEQLAQTDEATKEAIIEARRLSAMIANEDALRMSERQVTRSESGDSVSNTTTEGVVTPTSSDSGKTGDLNESETGGNGLGGKQNSREHGRPARKERTSFTNFDQLLSSQTPTALQPQSATLTPETTPQLTLHGASVLIDDGSEPGDKGIIHTKPTIDYSLQIEPASSRHPGWMIFRKYADFESLHEGLGPISRLHHIHSFGDKHPTLPMWKGQTKQVLRQNLEQYLRDALQHEQLAESERMRRFLEKDRGLGPPPAAVSAKAAISFPGHSSFESVGKGVLDVLTSAPKGVAGSGKAVFGGVTGVFASVGGKNKRFSSPATGRTKSWHLRDSSIACSSQEELRRQSEDGKSFTASTTSSELDRGIDKAPPSEDVEMRQPPCQGAIAIHKPSQPGLDVEVMNLPPPPSSMPEDYAGLKLSHSISEEKPENPIEASSFPSENELRLTAPQPPTAPSVAGGPSSPITEEETRMAVELIFAVINELYTLSSAWNIRRTLLNAAKSYILRPGNPNLEAIRVLLQDSMIDAHTSDETIAAHLRKLRENSLPTEEELKSLPPPPTDAEKEKLRVTARKLLVQRGMPQALRSVMGAAASGEALGKVFDCLQVDIVARGFIFALLLQALKAATI
ncbi:hypothetical protein VTN02DRAFT_6190 [Thermoascus thermophilus]